MSSPDDGADLRSSSSSVVRASLMILSTSSRIQSMLRLAPAEALASIRVESRATSPTLTSPTSAARRSTWSNRSASSSSWSLAKRAIVAWSGRSLAAMKRNAMSSIRRPSIL